MSSLLITFMRYARVVLVAILLWPLGSQATLDIPDFPLFLTSTGVPPNLILTLDDSGSMSRAFTPDLCGNPNAICDSGNYDSQLDGRFVKSAYYNPIYYNPTTTYTPPVNASGVSLSTSFTSAYINGFDTAYGTVNLSSLYSPSSGLFLHSTSDRYYQYMRHYSSDVRCNQVSGTDPCQYNSTVGSGTANWVNMQSPVVDCEDNAQCMSRTMPAYYYVYDGTNSGCSGTEAQRKVDNDCYDIRIVSSTSGADRDGDGIISSAEADERQNFANWYSFYRTRNLMTISATSLAMATLQENVRVAWQALNSCRGGTSSLVTADCEGWQTTSINFSNAIKPFTGTHKSNFYSWLLRLPTYTSTPLRQAMGRAGAYYQTGGSNSPYDDDLDSTADNHEHTCRGNYHLLMTDGIWNDSVTGYGNYDSTGRTLPDGVAYTSQRPYQDSNSDSLADVAFYYWVNDLRSTLANKVTPSVVDLSGSESSRYFNAKNDPATWQHMVNYTVGLGLTPFLAISGLTWDSNTYDGSYVNIVAGTQNWPATGSSGLNGNAADLWHAAINSRGRFYNVDGPSQLNAAFQEIVDTVSSQAATGGGAGLSANTTKIAFDAEGNSLTTAFEAKFNADWSGTLEALPIQTGATLGAPYWEAGVLIPAPHLRKIWTRNDGTIEEFKNCTGALATALNQDGGDPPVVDNLCTQRLAWLRGYTTITAASWASDIVTFTAPEHGLAVGNSIVVSGVTPAGYNRTYVVLSADTDSFTAALTMNPGAYTGGGKVRYASFRDRTVSVLGDIMNSDPIYAHEEDFGYSGSSVIGEGNYSGYIITKSGRIPMVYVGANDGMLHGFKATTAGDQAGVELFAFVPAGVYGNLSALTAPGYIQSHKYFVDGPPTLGDAYISGGWKTYLVGGLGAGGKSVYALDVSSPDNFVAAHVKWEFTDANDLGLTFSQPQIAPISASQWAAIFGNGYNSTSDRAFLYIVDLATGDQIAKIATNSDTANGLSTPYLYDDNGDRIVDAIYAGDLQGNLWKFEKSGSSWVLGNGGNPLFTARNADGDIQSITSQPKAIAAPAPYTGGVMVYFGTGRYLETNDLTNDDVQTFYAIWDDPDNTGTVPRTDLLEQEILNEDDVTIGGNTINFRTVTTNTPTTGNKGCYLDFPATTGSPSERIVSTPLIKFFQTLDTRVIVTTATPNDDPCDKGGISWLMELNAHCGRLSASPFDFNNDDQYDEDDAVDGDASASGLQLSSTLGITKTPLWLSTEPAPGATTGTAYKGFTGSTGAHQTIKQSDDPPPPSPPGGGGSPKRISWEQIL